MHLQDDVVVVLLGPSVLTEETVNDVDGDVDDGPDEVSKQVVGSLSGDKFSICGPFGLISLMKITSSSDLDMMTTCTRLWTNRKWIFPPKFT